MLLIIVARWQRSDTRRAIARDQAVDRDGDPELDEYNDYLAPLNQARGATARTGD